jgi:hypothetical protein
MHVPHNETRIYGHDHSGQVMYRFNSLGFRGEEYDPSARFRIALFGCSYAFGTGINFEDTYAYKFKEFLARAMSFEPAEVNLLSFAVGASSNDYATRAVLSQTDPTIDLVLFNLTHASRCEHVDGGRARTINIGSIDADNLEDSDPKTLAYYEFYSDELGAINLLKNLLLVQHHLKALDIGYVIQNGLFNFEPFRQIDACANFLACVDQRRLCHYPFLVWGRVDLAADGSHPGPVTQTAIAIHLLDFYGHLRVEQNDHGAGEAVLELARTLKETRAEWAYAEAALLYQKGNKADAIKMARGALNVDEVHAPFGRALLRVLSKPFRRASPKQMPRYDEAMASLAGDWLAKGGA